MKIKILVDTFLKQNIILPAAELPETEKLFLGKDTELSLDSFSFSDKGHYKISMLLNKKKYKDWFLFAKHTELLCALPVSKPLVTVEEVEAVYGRKITEAQMHDLLVCLNLFEITTPQRIKHFLAQTAHESGGLFYMQEQASGKKYEGRADLGNTEPGDGKKFKGAGVIQLTGRANYQKFSNYLRDPRVMEGVDYVSTHFPFTSAGFFWMNNNINTLIDQGASVKKVTKKVNGGYNGLEDRINYYNKACIAINR